MVKRMPDKGSNYWTKHTSYPTAEKSRVPSELNSTSRANNKQAEQELNVSRNRLNSIQRKSIHMLDSQRKLLEKSMLAYTEKMKEINNSKTNELFREIHTRNATRDDMAVKSPPSISGRSNISLPARLQSSANFRNRRIPSLKGFQQVKIPTPIPEGSSRGTTAETCDLNNTDSAKAIRRRLVARLRPSSSRQESNTRKSLDDESDCISTRSVPVISISQPTSKVCPRIVANSLPWMADADGSGSDSAYSSASEDLDTDCDNSPRDTDSQGDSETNVDQESKYVLTIPKIHVRRRGKKSRSERQQKLDTDLHRQVLLHQARTSF